MQSDAVTRREVLYSLYRSSCRMDGATGCLGDMQSGRVCVGGERGNDTQGLNQLRYREQFLAERLCDLRFGSCRIFFGIFETLIGESDY